jgi:hypothetical protein
MMSGEKRGDIIGPAIIAQQTVTRLSGFFLQTGLCRFRGPSQDDEVMSQGRRQIARLLRIRSRAVTKSMVNMEDGLQACVMFELLQQGETVATTGKGQREIRPVSRERLGYSV